MEVFNLIPTPSNSDTHKHSQIFNQSLQGDDTE